jgi:hypothetical protein
MMTPSIKERLWHKMRRDLATYVPETNGNQLLMCCVCGRFLPQESFDLEHIIPQQALKVDPPAVRSDPTTPTNIRAGNLLLCKQPLLYKDSKLYNNGCNSWKGRFYDKPISEIFSGRALQPGGPRITDTHIIAGLALCYLAMVAEFGFKITLMDSGRLLREQFFRPRKFHPSLDSRHHIILGGQPGTSPGEKVWSKPFAFTYERGACVVAARNFAMLLPVSNDPFSPIAQHLQIVPVRFKLRPDFRTFFK